MEVSGDAGWGTTGDAMVFLLVIGCPLVVLLVIAVFLDRKSKRVRGHVGRVRSGGEVSHRMDLMAAERLSAYDAGPSVTRHITDQPPTD
jgi:hypothetical protein